MSHTMLTSDALRARSVQASSEVLTEVRACDCACSRTDTTSSEKAILSCCVAVVTAVLTIVSKSCSVRQRLLLVSRLATLAEPGRHTMQAHHKAMLHTSCALQVDHRAVAS
jgi:hypothetical protein